MKKYIALRVAKGQKGADDVFFPSTGAASTKELTATGAAVVTVATESNATAAAPAEPAGTAAAAAAAAAAK